MKRTTIAIITTMFAYTACNASYVQRTFAQQWDNLVEGASIELYGNKNIIIGKATPTPTEDFKYTVNLYNGDKLLNTCVFTPISPKALNGKVVSSKYKTSSFSTNKILKELEFTLPKKSMRYKIICKRTIN